MSHISSAVLYPKSFNTKYVRVHFFHRNHKKTHSQLSFLNPFSYLITSSRGKKLFSFLLCLPDSLPEWLRAVVLGMQAEIRHRVRPYFDWLASFGSCPLIIHAALVIASSLIVCTCRYHQLQIQCPGYSGCHYQPFAWNLKWWINCFRCSPY